MFRVHPVLTISFLLAVFLPASASAAVNVCFDCHKKSEFQGKVVHKPLAKGECSSCHNPHVAHFKGLLERQGADLCYKCHLGKKKTFNQGVVHPPVRQGECLSCHAPHVSSRKGLLKDSLSATCFTCHDELKGKSKHTHAPFAKGQCSSCHYPHQSEFGQLLVNEPDKLCASCHTSQDLQNGHKNYPGSLRNCLSCHNPHGSDRKGLIRNVLHAPFAEGCNECHSVDGKEAGTRNCLRCHEEVSSGMHAVHSHLTGSSENTCVTCHSPHAADSRILLKGTQEQVCYSCHEDTLGRFRDKLYKHSGAEECSDCHDVHGSNELAMLRGDGNQVCERCHETQGEFTHPVGDKVTDPRSGQMVSCLSCHMPMGSDYKYQLTFSGSKDLCVQCHKKY